MDPKEGTLPIIFSILFFFTVFFYAILLLLTNTIDFLSVM